ncbi:DNA-binding transcriptional regulator, MarR family [Modestobacter sp. DSM 44400]|uniref:MarR family winged helix-turn-helix transcriptional regulator n=1 Tax=Modestobacter sp. DSM 44400 TaxID=1550230 RepID=UPI000897C9D4|nr:MarR family winged helix-turn-helix transcriptional regulator [Modestobacter sp. DSM 44400]SDY25534.1 DNA-binding transcriptional regulator, MarR family [Modestobacter sp. DSM 44400]
MHITRDTSERLTAGVGRLVRTGRQLGHRAAADLYGDLPPSGWALLASLEQGGEQRCSALADKLWVDVSVASRQVSALERSGYVARRPDPLDGRASLISVSAEGVAALARVRELRSQWAFGALEHWREDEARQFSVLLERMADDLERTGRRSSSPHPAAPVAD